MLLDEFEKAHRNVWQLFLQLFDDGRLTDRHGRTADFRQCVVILTSNLGSAVERGPGRLRARRRAPFPAGRGRARVQDVFAPEFLNRIDRIVVFRPFERGQMRALLERELALVLERRGFRTRPWAVEWDEAALELLPRRGSAPSSGRGRSSARWSATCSRRSRPRSSRRASRRATSSSSSPPATDEIEVAFVDPDASRPELVPAEAPAGRSDLTLGRVALEPEGTEAEAAFLRSELVSLVRRVRSWDEPKQDALAAAREPAFWQSEERHQVLGLIEYIDRLGAATATAERLAARLSSARDAHSRELLELLATRLHVLAAALAGLDAREASDATVSVRAGKAEDSAACGRFVEDLAAMYVGWADGRGMQYAGRNGDDGVVVLEVSGLGAYTLLRPEFGLHVLDLPHEEDRSFDRVTVLVDVEPAAQGADGAAAGRTAPNRRS